MSATTVSRGSAQVIEFATRQLFTQRIQNFALRAFNQGVVVRSLHSSVKPRSPRLVSISPPYKAQVLSKSTGSHSISYPPSQLQPRLNIPQAPTRSAAISTLKTPHTHHTNTLRKSAMWNSTQPDTPTCQMSYLTVPADNSSNYSESEASSRSTPLTTPSRTPDFNLTLEKHRLTELDLNEIHELLVDIAKNGGKIMLEAEHEFLVAAASKNNTSDLVTQYDKQVEEMVEQRVQAAYPGFAFLGEESYKHGTKLADSPTFVCDPIDGTLNFSKGVPNCAISLALTLDEKPVVGVVFNPFRGDMYTAIKNQGAFLTKLTTGKTYKLPLQPVPPPMPSLRSCLVAVEWGNQRQGPNWELRTDVHKKLLTDKKEGGAFCKSVRSNGSAALDFCYVAQGIIDVFWEGGVWVWDVCAGWIILEEAGGIVASANPGDWEPTLEGRVYFAVRHAKREEQKVVVEELWDIMGDRKFIY